MGVGEHGEPRLLPKPSQHAKDLGLYFEYSGAVLEDYKEEGSLPRL